MAKFGNAAITWTSTDDTNTQRVHLLEAPLRSLQPAYTQAVYWAQSLDRSVTESFAVSPGAYELVGEVRYDIGGQSLVDMIRAGARNITLTYYPNLTDPDTSYACKLIEPLTPVTVALDGDRGMFAEHAVTLRLRQTDQGSFAGLSRGTDVLFSWRAGESLADATFSRASSGTYANVTGTLQEASSGANARIEWWSTSQRGRTVPTLILETTMVNRVTESEDFGASTWTGSATLTSEQTAPDGSNAAWLVADNSAAATRTLTNSISLPTTRHASMSLFVRQGTTVGANGSRIHLATSSGGDVVSVVVDWSSGQAVLTWNNSTLQQVMAPERWDGGWWRIHGATTVGVSTGTYTFQIIPARGTSTDVGNIYCYGAQVVQV